MMSNNLEQIINEIEDYIDSCKFSPLSTTKILVNKDEIEELLEELKMKTPNEIRKYQRMLANKNGILEDAKQRADNIIAEANEQANALINNHEIMQQAYVQGNEIVQQAAEQAQKIIDEANEQANIIVEGALRYTDEKLAGIQNTIAYSMENIATRYDGYMKSLQKTLEIVIADRNQLNIPPKPQMPQQNMNIQPQPAAASEEETFSEEDMDEDFEDYRVEMDDDIEE